MYQEFFARSDLLVWPLIGLLLFVAIFVGVLAYVFLGLRDRDQLERLASLPLQPDTETAGQTEGRAR